MSEKRQADRQLTIDQGVAAIAALDDGTVLEGVVADSSLGGARVGGPTTGLAVGDQVRLVFVFLSGERVEYRCEVRHVDAERTFYGVKFLAEPRRVDNA